MIEYQTLTPDETKIDPVSLERLTSIDRYPSQWELENLYKKAETPELKCGDVIRISSICHTFAKYFLISSVNIKQLEI